MKKFSLLSSPVRIGGLELKNRMVMPAIGTGYAYADGSVTQRLIAYHAERAKGGVGLIILEATYVHPSGKGFKNQPGIYSDRLLPGLRRLVDAVHAQGAKIAIQIYHTGQQTTSAVTGQPIVAPSALPCATIGEVPKELTKEEIAFLVRAFAEAAQRAKAAGFDAVEVHGAHGYLINQFLSPLANKRTDKYGGSLENRMRFPLEVVRAVRRAVGPDYPVLYRLSADEKISGGLTLEETKVFARRLEQEGVNALHVSAGIYESIAWFMQPMYLPRGCLVDLAQGIKSAVNLPVIAVGRINDPDLAEEILAAGKADLIAFGRQLLADPETPKKVLEGRPEEIRRCIACCQGCIEELFQGGAIRCTINARTGFERESPLEKAVKPRKVLVVGGGAAGMEAARVAALRGHQVTLWEKESQLGGQLPLAYTPPQKGEIAGLRDYLTKEMERLGVQVKLNQKATLEAIRQEKPDAVVLATGARPAGLNLPGGKEQNVVTSWEVLKGKVQVGKKVAVIGGGMVGCETAEYLAEKGHQVTVLEMLTKVAVDASPLVGPWLVERLKILGVEIITEAKVKAFQQGTVVYSQQGQDKKVSDVETVVLAVGSLAEDGLAREMEGSGIDYYVIGDAVSPRRITQAIYEAMRVGQEL